MNFDALKKLKKTYLKTDFSKEFKEKGWEELKRKIEVIENRKKLKIFARPFAYLLITIFILGGSLGIAAASGALPGEPLYPLKRVAEETIRVATGNHLVRVDNRAKEIVKLSEKEKNGKKGENIRQTVEDYRQAVSEARNSGKNRNEQERQKLERELLENEKEFREAYNRTENEHLDKAIETARSGREEKDKEDNDEKEDNKESSKLDTREESRPDEDDVKEDQASGKSSGKD